MAPRPPHVGWCGFPSSSLLGGAAMVGVAFPFLFGVVLFSLLGGVTLSSFLLGGIPLTPSSCWVLLVLYFFGGWCWFLLLLFGGAAFFQILAVVLPFSAAPFWNRIKQCLSELKLEFLGGGAVFRCFPFLCFGFLLLLLLGVVCFLPLPCGWWVVFSSLSFWVWVNLRFLAEVLPFSS